MTASRADAKVKLDQAKSNFEAATSTHGQMVAAHGPDWTLWPVGSHWFQAESLVEQLSAEIDLLADPVAPAPVPTPTPSPTPADCWDRKATEAVHANSDQIVADFLKYAGPLGKFFIEVAHDVVKSHDTSVAYKVSSAGKPGAMDDEFWVSIGAKGGLSNDQHLWIEDLVADRWHDLDGVSFDSSGKLASWRFGSSMPAGSIQTPHVPFKLHQGATAAMFPLARGIVYPHEIAAGEIPHALCFVAANLGPSPNPYPANTQNGYSTGNAGAWLGKSVAGHVPLGIKMQMDPSVPIPSTLSPGKKTFMRCLQEYGMYCRDRGSDLSLHGEDLDGGGASIQAWKDAGVPLSDTHVLDLSDLPWDKMRVLVAPTP